MHVPVILRKVQAGIQRQSCRVIASLSYTDCLLPPVTKADRMAGSVGLARRAPQLSDIVGMILDFSRSDGWSLTIPRGDAEGVAKLTGRSGAEFAKP